jgi:copper(I)-binding protein
MKAVFRLAALIAFAFATTAASAAEYSLGDLVIANPVARATPPNAPVSGGYMTIRNNGSQADRLVAASADFAGMTQIHEMTMDGDVMKMREIEGGLEIPPGEEVVLKSGGLHIMFMKLGEQLAKGEKRDVTLTFETAGEITVEFEVGGMAGEMSHN